jgi:uncharacterized protein (TIGR02996 family)
MSDEDAFLAAVRAAPDDNTPRLVYADWLDEHGRPGGAFLRAECELSALNPADPRRSELQAVVRGTSAGVDPGWLAAVSRAPIENCGVEFQFRCPRRWEELRPSADEAVRFCDECRREVVFCRTIEVAQTHAALGDCIAVDPRLARKPRDLESSFWELGMVMGMALPGEEEADPKGEEPPPGRRGRR